MQVELKELETVTAASSSDNAAVELAMANGGGGGWSSMSLLLVVVAVAVSGWAVAPCRAAIEGVHIVGDKQGWAPNINYTGWTNTSHFYVHDWLGFRYQKDVFDVAQVNKTAYEQCISTDPINYWNKTVTYLELNHTGHYYFICTKGTCYNGMKLAILVEKKPVPASAPVTSHDKSGSPSEFSKTIFLPLLVALSTVSSVIFRM